MGHYIGPKARINRRLGLDVYDSSGAVRASHRRPQPPGRPPARRRRPTDYARALAEKQKIRHHYGMTQRQLKRFFDLAKRLGGNKGDNLLLLCERRLDNIVWKGGFAKTRVQARQSVAHGHFLVNGRRTSVPSYIVREGDTIQVRKRENLRKIYGSRTEGSDRVEAGFLAVDPKELVIKMVRLPDKDEIGLPVDIQVVVEFLSR
jgi:small subunit ribosomal protein S4